MIEALKEHCKTHGLDESQLEEIIDYIDFDKNIIKDADGVASGKLISIAAEHSSDKTKADLDKTIDIVVRERDDKFAENMLGNITHDPDNRFTNVATRAIKKSIKYVITHPTTVTKENINTIVFSLRLHFSK